MTALDARGRDRTGATREPGPRHRFPGLHAVDRADTWDDETRRVVLARLDPPRSLAFFDDAEAACGHALVARLLELGPDDRVPVVWMIDDRLARGEGDGYRYERMPNDRDAWRRSLAGLDADACERGGVSFAALGDEDQRELLERVRTRGDDWCGMPPARVWSLWIRYVCAAYYAHPDAWDEMGFGGPAYPRGYGALGLDHREPWEVPDTANVDPVPWAQRIEAARRRHHPGGHGRIGDGQRSAPTPQEPGR